MNRKTLLVILLVLLSVAFGSLTAFGFVSLDGDLEINGYLRNDFGVRLNDGEGANLGWEKGDVYLVRNTLQIESKFKATDQIQFFATYRGVYDAAYDLSSDIKDRIVDDGARNSFKKESDLREAYVDFTPEKWLVRVGKQQIVWGESDGYRMADIVNPLDYSSHYIFPSWEDIRIPINAVRAMGYFGSLMTEFVFVPNVMDGGFQATKFGPAGSNWNPGFPQFLVDAIDASKPDSDLDSAEYGFRVKYVNPATGTDVGAFFYRSRHDNPTFKEGWLASAGAGDPTNIFEYPYTTDIGGTFNYQVPFKIPGFQAPVLRGEFVYKMDEPFNSYDTLKIYQKDSLQYMIGYDGNFFNRFLNPSGTSFYHSLQIFQKYVFNADDDMNAGMGDDDDYMTFGTFYMSTKYMSGRLTPSFFGLYNIKGESWAQFQVEYQHQQNWQFGVGVNLLDADNSSKPYFGVFPENDEIYGWIRYSW